MDKQAIRRELGRVQGIDVVTEVDRELFPVSIAVGIVCDSRGPGEVERCMKQVLTSVLENVLQHGLTSDCDLELWQSALPAWFVKEFRPERTRSEADADLAYWQSLEPDQQSEYERRQRWELLAWVYWVGTARRAWSWFGSGVTSEEHLVVVLGAESFPFPIQSFLWLARASGGLKCTVGPAAATQE